jgi:uncharacterized protein
VLLESQYPAGVALGQIVMVHGLEGSSRSGYMLRLAAAALERGFAAHRFNMRSCGGTELQCPTLYHAGLTGDLLFVLRALTAGGAGPAFLVGFSLGGNVVLKLAGELGEAAIGLIDGVCAVSTPLDLEACARSIAESRNRLYERRFVRLMLRRLSATGRYTARDLAGLRSVIGIDERITAPSFGFRDARHYYSTQSALRFLDAIGVPALLIQSKDDTFIPFRIFETTAVRANPRIELAATDNGGHVGFIARGDGRFWLNEAIMEWILARSVQEPMVQK